MPWIHQHSQWPKFSWNDNALIVALADCRFQQGKLLGKMTALGFDLQQEASLNTLTNDIVKSSEIEGERLNRGEVRSSVARRLGMDMAGMVPTNRNVDGIVEMMLDATQNYREKLTADRLFDWHAALFPTGRSGMHKIATGTWRKDENGPMQVVSGPFGRETVHFEAPAASMLADEMSIFLDWFENSPPIDPIIKAAIAHFWFVTIHPFDDGNGRIARAIADMALARADNSATRFYSMSTRIEAERHDYYAQLERQQRATPDITEWIGWFISCLNRAIETADTALETVLHKARLWDTANKVGVNARQTVILYRMLDGFKGHMNTSKYAKIAKCSNDTALRDIQALVNAGIFQKNASGGRSTSYRLFDITDKE
ncbi:Fic family protein [Thalassospira sp.]|uniref:Fic family protein n=1 Tax=Thalassospira sp. TaxID=1912094 RepID=UPI0032EFD4AB